MKHTSWKAKNRGSLKTALLVIALLTSIFYAFYSGFRAPSLWSVNYYQVSFVDGFYRRALFGTFLAPLGCVRFDYFVIQKIQFLILFLAVCLFIYFGLKHQEVPALSVFFASSAGGYFFHEVGYIEQFLWLLAVVILFALKKNRIYFASVCLCLSVMVHEMAVFMVLPIVLAYMVIHKNETFSSGIRIFIPSVVTFLIIYQWLQVVPANTIGQYVERATGCGYPVRSDYFQIYESQFLGQRAHLYYNAKQLFLNILPVVLLAYMLAFSIKKKLDFSKLREYLILLCCTSPLLLGFFGWDSDRWIFLAFTQTIIVGLIASSKMRETNSGNLLSSPIFFIPLILVALLLHLEYFDNFSPRAFSLGNLRSFMDYVIHQITTLPSV